jgi:hypothetical protein
MVCRCSSLEAERRCLNSELWHACAGPLVSLPPVGSCVVYFPQGHTEQVKTGCPTHSPPICHTGWRTFFSFRTSSSLSFCAAKKRVIFCEDVFYSFMLMAIFILFWWVGDSINTEGVGCSYPKLSQPSFTAHLSAGQCHPSCMDMIPKQWFCFVVFFWGHHACLAHSLTFSPSMLICK